MVLFSWDGEMVGWSVSALFSLVFWPWLGSPADLSTPFPACDFFFLGEGLCWNKDWGFFSVPTVISIN